MKPIAFALLVVSMTLAPVALAGSDGYPKIVRFHTQLPDVSYGSEVTARYDGQALTSIETIDRDDDGDVVTDYRFDDGEVVAAERTIMGYNDAGRQVVRHKKTMSLQEIRKSARFFQEAASGLQGKASVGELRSVVMGDAACYLTFTNRAGKEWTERGLFDLCHEGEAFIGKEVALTYAYLPIMAESCQGAPDCHDTVTRPIISRLAKGAPLSCAPTEQVVFRCRAGEKEIAVCQTDKLPAQFRYGSAPIPDLVVPADPLAAIDAMVGENVPFSGGGGSWLRFYDPPYAYTVYSGVGKWGDEGAIETRQGVVIERGGEKIAVVSCDDERAGSLGPAWYEEEGITPAGESFDFPF